MTQHRVRPRWLDIAQLGAILVVGTLIILQGQNLKELRAEVQKDLRTETHHLAQLIGRISSSQAQSSRGGAVDYASTYLGDGVVMCYVKPLGVHMFLESADKGLTPHLCRGVGWEPEISSVFTRLIRPGGYVLDVGTNIGYFTVMFAQRVGPEGRVMGIEASPRTYELAGASLEMLGYLSSNTQLLNKAVFSEDGKTVSITIDKKRPLNNYLSTAINNSKLYQKDWSTSEVQTTTIDSAVQSWNRLDFIKIDVEGAEAEAYKGLKKTIQRFPDIIVVVEVNTLRMGPETARPFYQSMQKDFPQLRRIVGQQIKPTTVDELLANMQTDELVVLTKQDL